MLTTMFSWYSNFRVSGQSTRAAVPNLFSYHGPVGRYRVLLRTGNIAAWLKDHEWPEYIFLVSHRGLVPNDLRTGTSPRTEGWGPLDQITPKLPQSENLIWISVYFYAATEKRLLHPCLFCHEGHKGCLFVWKCVFVFSSNAWGGTFSVLQRATTHKKNLTSLYFTNLYCEPKRMSWEETGHFCLYAMRCVCVCVWMCLSRYSHTNKDTFWEDKIVVQILWGNVLKDLQKSRWID